MKKGLFIVRESFNSAVLSLWSNKLRSFLTLLGIVIGVTTIIAILSVINGLNKTVTDTFATLGTRVLYVERNVWDKSKDDSGESKKKKHRAWWRFPMMRERELRAIENVSLAEHVVSTSNNRSMVSYKDTKSDGVTIYGSNSDLINVRPFEVIEGRFFTAFENEKSRFVCVLGHTIYNELFVKNEIDGIGQNIKIGSMNYRVLGYFDKIGKMSFGFNNDDDDFKVYVPLNTFFKQYGRSGGYGQILVSARIEDDLDALESELTNVLRRVRKVPVKDPNNFGVNRQSYLLEEYEKSTRTLWTFIIGIVGLSLLVGGIGVMNIMLISVTERTKEIGLRKAVGARRSYVLFQFLLEALVVCWLGGIIGISLGTGFTWAVSMLTPVPFALSINSIYLGFFFTSGIGIFFGLYPAAKAAYLDPVDALRYE